MALMSVVRREGSTRMRLLFLTFLVTVSSACGRTEPTGFTLHSGKVERINGCHVLLDSAFIANDARRTSVRTACGAPSSALNEERWWGDQPAPLAFTVDVGDCMLLDTTYFCLDEVQPGETASFRAGYMKRPSGAVIERIEGK